MPETWHVVNDADIIPKVGKFVRMYKRPGARVIVDSKGSIVVRPSALELNLRPSEICPSRRHPLVLCWMVCAVQEHADVSHCMDLYCVAWLGF